MRSHIFTFAAITLSTSLCLVAVRTPYSTEAVLRSASQHVQASGEKEILESCPVTKSPANPFVPPQPYWTNHGPDAFWFGTPKLWILLPNNGTWHVLPTDSKGQIAYAARDIKVYSQKQSWYREGFDGRRTPLGPPCLYCEPGLKVTGERLGTPATPLVANANTVSASPPYIMVGFDIPTLGCWKISGRFEDTELSFERRKI